MVEYENRQFPQTKQHIYHNVVVCNIYVIVAVVVCSTEFIEIHKIAAENTFQKNIAVVCSFPQVWVRHKEKGKHKGNAEKQFIV